MAVLCVTIQETIFRMLRSLEANAKLALKPIHFALQEIGDPNSSTCIGHYPSVTDWDRMVGSCCGKIARMARFLLL